MALIPKNSYPGQIDTTDPTGYPQGKARNISAPAAGDGTPWESLLINDVFGFQQALLAAAGLTPSGSPDKVGASQYLTALQALFEPVFSKKSAFNKNFGLTTADILQIGATIVASRILETDGTGKVISVAKGTAYNKNFGTTVGTVCDGNDSRLGLAGASLSTGNLLYIEDQKTSGTAGGTPTGATWNKRALNTSVVATITGASVAGDVITLPDGNYWIEAVAPVYSGSGQIIHKLRLRNTSDAVDELLGSQARINGDNVNNVRVAFHDVLFGPLTVASGPKNYELQQYFSAAESSGLGYPASLSVNEVYSQIKIWKVG